MTRSDWIRSGHESERSDHTPPWTAGVRTEFNVTETTWRGEATESSDGDVAGSADDATATPPRRRLSPLRLLLLIVLVAGASAGAFFLARQVVEQSAVGLKGAWFAPYVDATLVPTYPFETPTEDGGKDVVLGFVVADRDGRCEPTWGTFVDLEGAATSFDLDRRIARLRTAGGEPIVSFGGLINDELALRCETPEDLASAYRKVIDRYDLTTIDIDVEGEAQSDEAANQRRAAALRILQDEAEGRGDDLAVWLTVPVGVDGMTSAGLRMVLTTLEAGVDLTGVNGMVMDYGAGRPPGTSMWQASEQALVSLHGQLARAYRSVGSTMSDSDVWARVGATPMIGQNDTPDDVFTLDDARSLLDFAQRRGLGRLSMWSANRDAPCGKQIDGAAVSNTCSSEDQRPGEFAATLNQLSGRPGPSGSTDGSTAPSSVDRPSVRAVVDDARTSPYPIWQAETVYVMGEKVVWHGNVFEAKWWTKNDMPDAPVENEWDSPWRFLGPVLPTDRPPPRPNVPDGTYPKWSELASYARGSRVLHQGFAYEAKWFTLGDTPRPDRPWESPWQIIVEDDASSDPASSTTTTVPVNPSGPPIPSASGAARSSP
jgi:chitinase